MNQTRHGVRNLNGPNMDGKYNGRRQSCPHYRAPDLIPTHKGPTTGIAKDGGFVSAFATFCSGCGEKLYDSETP